ncbi:MAG: tRNA-intron lyase [Candidatus Woesearchaeota archaeon]
MTKKAKSAADKLFEGEVKESIDSENIVKHDDESDEKNPKKEVRDRRERRDDEGQTEPGEKRKDKTPIKAFFIKTRVITENSDNARELYNQSRYGTIIEDGRVQLSLHEALWLLEKGKIVVYDSKNKSLNTELFMRRSKRLEPNFWIRYCVYKDIRNRGYIIKTALKFGADFRIYDRGVKPGEDHAKWVVFPVHEASTLTWHEFAAKNRVAHSTKKRLLLAVVDDEADVSYWEARWVRP